MILFDHVKGVTYYFNYFMYSFLGMLSVCEPCMSTRGFRLDLFLEGDASSDALYQSDDSLIGHANWTPDVGFNNWSTAILISYNLVYFIKSNF